MIQCLDRSKKTTIGNYNLVVIDETSIVNSTLFELKNRYYLTKVDVSGKVIIH